MVYGEVQGEPAEGAGMTNEQIKARVQRFMEDNDLHDDNEHTCGYSQESIRHDIESLYREAMAGGLEQAAGEMVSSGNEWLDGWIKWCRQEAERVKGGG
jgi:hypothetical protein